MFEVQDECSVRHDRPTFVVNVPELSSEMTFEQFRALDNDIPESYMRKRFHDIPHMATRQTFEYAAGMARRDFLNRMKTFQMYETKMTLEREGKTKIPKVPAYQTERRTGAVDEFVGDMDSGLPQMD
jgi:hypothetical protein